MGPVRSSIRTPSLVAHMRLLYACVQLAYIFIQQISGRVLALYALIGIVTNSYSSMTRFKVDFEVSVDCQNCQKSGKSLINALNPQNFRACGAKKTACYARRGNLITPS